MTSFTTIFCAAARKLCTKSEARKRTKSVYQTKRRGTKKKEIWCEIMESRIVDTHCSVLNRKTQHGVGN